MPFIKRRAPAPTRANRPDADPSQAATRRAAALAMAGDPEAVHALLAALAQEQAPELRQAIVTALIASGSEAAAAGLAQLVGSEDAAIRNEAIVALRCLGAAAAAALSGLLDHPDPDRRQLAIGALQALPPPEARARLRAMLHHDPEVIVGLAAVEALGQFGEAEDVGALRAFAARFPTEPLVRFAVVQVVGQIGAEASP